MNTTINNFDILASLPESPTAPAYAPASEPNLQITLASIIASIASPEHRSTMDAALERGQACAVPRVFGTGSQKQERAWAEEGLHNLDLYREFLLAPGAERRRAYRQSVMPSEKP